MLKQGEIYKLSKHNAYGICGGIIPMDTEISGVRYFTLENIGFHYIIFIVNNPSMEGLNAEFYMLATNYDEKDFLDTNINVWKEFSVFAHLEDGEIQGICSPSCSSSIFILSIIYPSKYDC